MAGIEKALDLLHLSLSRIAEGVGVGYDTVKGWRVGRSRPSRSNREALAQFLRQHAHELLRTADQLETADDEDSEA